MALSKLELAVDTGQWEGGLKKAMTALDNFVESTGGVNGALQKNEQAMTKFVQSMGEMATSATKPKTAMRELVGTIGELQVRYNSLSATDKRGAFGQALQSSMTKLKQRAGELKDQVADLNEELAHRASDTKFTDGLNQMTGVAGSCASAFVTLTGDSKEFETVIMDLAKIQSVVGAVEALTKAFQAQNLVLMENPYVALAAAIAAASVAIYEFAKSANEATEEEKKQAEQTKALQDAMNKMKSSVATAVGSAVGEYKRLQEEWKRLKTEHEKTEWIEKNRTAFENLGLNIYDLSSAESVLVTNTSKVVPAIMARAKAAAAYQMIVSAYTKYFEGMNRIDSIQGGGHFNDAAKTVARGEAAAMTDEEVEWAESKGFRSLGSGGRDFSDPMFGHASTTSMVLAQELSKKRAAEAAEIYKGNVKALTDELNKSINTAEGWINDANADIQAAGGLVTAPTSTPSHATTTTKPTKPKKTKVINKKTPKVKEEKVEATATGDAKLEEQLNQLQEKRKQLTSGTYEALKLDMQIDKIEEQINKNTISAKTNLRDAYQDELNKLAGKTDDVSVGRSEWLGNEVKTLNEELDKLTNAGVKSYQDKLNIKLEELKKTQSQYAVNSGEYSNIQLQINDVQREIDDQVVDGLLKQIDLYKKRISDNPDISDSEVIEITEQIAKIKSQIISAKGGITELKKGEQVTFKFVVDDKELDELKKNLPKDSKVDVTYNIKQEGEPVVAKDSKADVTYNVKQEGEPVVAKDSKADVIYNVKQEGEPVVAKDSKADVTYNVKQEGEPVVAKDSKADVTYNVKQEGEPVVAKDSKADVTYNVKQEGEPIVANDSKANVTYNIKQEGKEPEVKDKEVVVTFTTDDSNVSKSIQEFASMHPHIPVELTVDTKPIETAAIGSQKWFSELKFENSNVEIGSPEYNSVESNRVDAKTAQNLLPYAQKAGLGSEMNEQLVSIKAGVDITDDVWQTLVDQINAKLKELKIDPIQIDVKTGNLKSIEKTTSKTATVAKGLSEDFNAASSALGSFADKSKAAAKAEQAFTIASAIATLVGQFASMPKGAEIWSWIAGTIAGVATLATAVAQIKSISSGSYAEGGIVPGTPNGDGHDTSYVYASPGEVILNRAQQNNLAAQLEGGQGSSSTPYLSTELIYLGLNNFGRRTGRGELVFSKTR